VKVKRNTLLPIRNGDVHIVITY